MPDALVPTAIAAEAAALASTDWTAMDDAERGAILPKLYDTTARRSLLAKWHLVSRPTIAFM